MTEYIVKQQVLEKLDEFVKLNEDCGFECTALNLAMVSNMIDHIHAADVVPVVHGHWTLERDPDAGDKPVCFHCSVCDSDGCHTSIRIAYKYCPNCGAKMDEEDC